MIIVGMNTHARKTKNLDDSLLPTRHNAVMQKSFRPTFNYELSLIIAVDSIQLMLTNMMSLTLDASVLLPLT